MFRELSLIPNIRYKVEFPYIIIISYQYFFTIKRKKNIAQILCKPTRRFLWNILYEITCNFKKNMINQKVPEHHCECSGAFMLIPSLPNLYGVCLLILYNRHFSPVYYLFWSYDPTAVSRYAKRCSSTSCMPASFGLILKSAQVVGINHINPVVSQILTNNS